MIWGVVLDPAEVAVGRQELDLNALSGIAVEQQGIDWGDAAIQAYMAEQRIGSTAVDYRIPNRTVSIPLGLGMDDSGSFDSARTALTQKVALLHREGGWLKRESARAKLYADIVSATLHIPDRYGETAELEDAVTLTLECLPDFYGDEITLDLVTATGQDATVLQLHGSPAVIEGDHPGRVRIVLSEGGQADRNGVIWGFRSRHYDPAASAKLSYLASELTPVDPAVRIAGFAYDWSASVIKVTDPPTGSWLTVAELQATGTPLTHIGSYRVWARGYSGGSPPSSVRLAWTTNLAGGVLNTPVQLPNRRRQLIDLGEIRLDANPLGSAQWLGLIEILAADPADDFVLDKVWLQPLDDSAGLLLSSDAAPIQSIETAAYAGTVADDASAGTVAWGTPANAEGAGTGYGAAAPFTTGANSHYLKATGYGFAVPGAATVLGIIARISRSFSVHGPANVNPFIQDETVTLVKAGTIDEPFLGRGQPARWPVGLSGAEYGAWNDLWDDTWTPADVNDAGFGIVLQIAGQQAIAYVLSMQLTVVYALGVPGPADAVLYQSQVAELRTDGMFRAAGGVYGPISVVQGDLPRIPVSGLEGRAVELLALATTSHTPSSPQPNPDIDAWFAAPTRQVKYRPCYLYRP